MKESDTLKDFEDLAKKMPISLRMKSMDDEEEKEEDWSEIGPEWCG